MPQSIRSLARFAFPAAAAPLAALGLAAGAAAAPVAFDTGPGATGSSYDVILDSGLQFGAAAVHANARSGRLATINSAAEQAFIEGLLLSEGAPTGSYWFGLAKGADPDTLVYIDGESVDYTNFAPGQPDNVENVESKFAVLWTADGDGATTSRRGGWNDVPTEGYPNPVVSPGEDAADLLRAGYILEIPAAQPGPGPSPAPIPLPAAAYAFPLGAVVAGLAARRMSRRR